MWEVIHAFGWNPSSVQHRGGVWEVVDGDQKYALKESHAPREKLYVLYRMLEEVRAAGYPNLLPWVPTEDGEIVVSAYGSQWYATPWKESEDEHVSATELASSLGYFHRLAEPIATQFPKLHQIVDTNALESWKEREVRVSDWQSSLEEGEAAISQKNANLPKSGFTFAIHGINRYLELEKGVAPRYTICHNRIHPTNVLTGENGLFWIDFDHAELDSPVKDLATLIHRFPEESPAEILAAYEQENKLLPKERRLLAVFLSYPERLVRNMERQEEIADLSREYAHIQECNKLVKMLWPAKKKKRSRQNRNR
ncbi:phosphotransferase [Shimazuella kribbensis]|uniref:phosphotransferase n=1 Tax=Shimazuella kribbensis TaxID=139808 RepID=UPI0004132F2E|nr:phosphotransferase [Shimazuella kribbensis]